MFEAGARRQHDATEVPVATKRRRYPLLPLDNQNIDFCEGDNDVAFRCGCVRISRRGWTEADVYGQPIGVHEVYPAASMVQRGWAGGLPRNRYHAIFGAPSPADAIFLGCFATIEAAAAAWDEEARRRNWRIANFPIDAGEQKATQVLRQHTALVGAAGFPTVPSDSRWRALQLRAALSAAHSCGKVWVDEASLQQREHWSSPGNMLCLSFQPHIFATHKARACGTGWQDEPPRHSALTWWAAKEMHRARAVRALIERHGERGTPLDDASGGGSALSYSTSYAARLRREAVILSGSWVLNFQCVPHVDEPCMPTMSSVCRH